MHYDRAIRQIHSHFGIVGSIIGDALLTVFGTLPSEKNKSLDALLSAYEIQTVARSLREAMSERKEIIEKNRSLTPAEQKVYQAVLLEVGVGIDGGEVFYGNIGSSERMTNTVIGDNVNSASRLEGLTRMYRVPIICSAYVADEVMSVTNRFLFIELDTVQVKGKTEGKRVFFPIDTQVAEEEELERFKQFSLGLSLYYEGKWPEAYKIFASSGVLAASLFLQRIEGREAPKGWKGVWTMETK
jgi:class 3 adenylate cyclase